MLSYFTCALVIAIFLLLVTLLLVIVSQALAVGGLRLELVLVAILFVEGVESLVALITFTIGFLQVTLLALRIAPVGSVVTALV